MNGFSPTEVMLLAGLALSIIAAAVLGLLPVRRKR